MSRGRTVSRGLRVDPQIVRPAALSAAGRRHGRVAFLRDPYRGEIVLRTAGWRDAAQELLATVALASARAPTSGWTWRWWRQRH